MEAKREAIAKAEEETGETEEEVANAHAAAFTAVEKLEKSALRPKAKKITDVVQQKTIKKSLRVSVSFEVSASGRTILDKVLEIICISRCRGLCGVHEQGRKVNPDSRGSHCEDRHRRALQGPVRTASQKN